MLVICQVKNIAHCGLNEITNYNLDEKVLPQKNICCAVRLYSTCYTISGALMIKVKVQAVFGTLYDKSESTSCIRGANNKSEGTSCIRVANEQSESTSCIRGTTPSHK